MTKRKYNNIVCARCGTIARGGEFVEAIDGHRPRRICDVCEIVEYGMPVEEKEVEPQNNLKQEEIKMLVGQINNYRENIKDMSMNNRFRQTNEESITEMQKRLDFLYLMD